MQTCRVDWRAYLLRQLSAVSGRCASDAESQVDIAFAVYAPLACGDEFLNMLYAKRHLLSFLVARYSSAVDFYSSRTNDVGRYLRQSESRSYDQSTTAAQSSRRADTVAQSREDSTARSETQSVSQDYQYGRSRARQEADSRDVGRGENASRSQGQSSEDASAREDGQGQSTGFGFVTNWDTGCQLFTSYDSTRTTIQPFFQNQRTATGSSEHVDSRSAQNRQDVDRSQARSDYQARSRESSFDSSESYSVFTAAADNRSYSAAVSVGSGRGFTNSDTTQRDRGRGYGIAESRSTTQNSSRTQGEGRAEAKMDSTGTSFSRHDVTAQDLSDISKHLTMMMDANEKDLNEYISSRQRMLFIAAYLQRYAEWGCLLDDGRPYSIRGDAFDQQKVWADRRYDYRAGISGRCEYSGWFARC